MRVLHVTNAYPYEDYESYGIFIKEQIDSLLDIGVENKTVFINARKKGSGEYFKHFKNIKNIIDSFQPDVVHCHHEFSLIPFSLLRIHQPIILSLLGDLEKRGKVNKYIFRLFVPITRKVILKNKMVEDPSYAYLPNGVNLNLFKTSNKIEAKRILNLKLDIKYVLFVSATLNNPIKRYDKFQAVLNKINDEYGNQFQPLILSGVTRELVPIYFNAAEFLLFTSDHEGSPNAIKEAMACNLPIVSTDVGNVQQLFGNSCGNFVANTGSVDELFELSKIALEYPKNKINGRARLEEAGLTIDTVAQKLYALYNEVICE